MTEWQPIETAPKEGALIDLWVVASRQWRPHGEASRVTDCRWLDGRWIEYTYDGDDVPVENEHYTATHWMPLPEPPNADSAEYTAIKGKYCYDPRPELYAQR
jgi:hypothetical protein